MNLPKINMVFHGRWDWVFERILYLYQSQCKEFLITPSVHPIKGYDVYQYWRPGSVRAQAMSKNTNSNSEFYRRGIHMVHDSPYDKKRSNSDYRIGVIQRYHSILCTSKEQQNFYSNYHNNVHYVPLGVFEDRIMQPPKNESKLSLGFKARLYKDGVKGEQLLFQIARKLSSNKYEFVIVSPNAKKLINDLQNLGFTVKTSGNIDVLLVCSKYEGTPLPLVEACASGVYVLSTPVGEAPQILGKKQICSSSDDFVEQLNRLYDNRSLLLNFVNNGPHLVKNRTWENFFQQSENLWNSILQ
jgi:glycosyltransferase involved in cell wall biosynthesis